MYPGQSIMTVKRGIALIISAVLLLLSACTTRYERTQAKADVSACHIIYDAGSKRTRLYIYQQTATGWLKHRGPRTDALANPVRAIRGKTMADAGTVVDDIVAALDKMRRDGPVDKEDIPQWPAFDWQEQCDIDAVSVYATAGMRLAEQQDAVASEMLWGMLNDRLSAAAGLKVTTRTLSGYEEGLFAWLATREGRGDDNFGVAEMGGASIQVTFPCPFCEASRQVKVKGHSVPLYSHSFLGWGQDEAWKKLGSSAACARGAGIDNPDWSVADCAVGMAAFSDAAADIEKQIRAADGLHWYLNDAFRYMQDDDIDQFCRKGIDSGFEPLSSCFRAVYLQNVIDTLGLPADAEPGDVDWTLGAVICTVTRCLESE